MKSLFLSSTLLVLISHNAHAQQFNPYLNGPENYKAPSLVDSCENIIRRKQDLLVNGFPRNQLRDYADPIGNYMGSLSTQKLDFMIPILCDLMCVRFPQGFEHSLGAPQFSWFTASNILNGYGESANSRIADVYIAPQIVSPIIKDADVLKERQETALSLLVTPTQNQGQTGLVVDIHQYGETYRNYALRMRLLADRIDGGAVPTFPAPSRATRPADQRLRRACEILIALEEAQTKPIPAAGEAALVKELGTLQQDFSAPTLVEYLAKPVEGVDKAQVKGALLAIGEPAIPEVLRFLRADLRSPESLQEGLSLLIALCKSPDAAKARLLQTAQTDEDGAKLFDAEATRLLQ